MSLQIKKEDGVVYKPVFLQILSDIPGGITIKTDRFSDTTKEIKKGAMLSASASSIGFYNVIKTVRLTAPGITNTTILAVEPTDHLFKVGENIFLQGGTAGTITRVSSTAIAVEIAHKVIASGAVLYEAAGVGASAALYAASAILRDTMKVRDDKGNLLDNLFAGAVIRGDVKESDLPYFVTAQQKTDLTDRIYWM